MQFQELGIPGAFRISLEPVSDNRGFFARSFCEDEFAAAGLPAHYPQASVSYSRQRGTLRGIHFRPHGDEAKLIRCVAGAAYDVIVDLRPTSPAFGRWEAIELSAQNRLAVFVPPGCAHAHEALTDDIELQYQMTVPYEPGEVGVRWDDPTLAIDWPLLPTVLSERDRALPSLEELRLEVTR